MRKLIGGLSSAGSARRITLLTAPLRDLIFIRRGLDLVLPKLAKVISNLAEFANKYKDMPTLGFTHFQAAQPITVGKRASQWAQDLIMDLEDIEIVRSALRARGAQGTTGTQASFMEIFHKDGDKIDKLNEMLCEVSLRTGATLYTRFKEKRGGGEEGW